MKKCKRIYSLIMCIIPLIFLLYPLSYVYSQDEAYEDQIIKEQSNYQEINSLEDELKKINGQGASKILPELNTDGLIEKAAKGEFKINIKKIINNLIQYLMKEVLTNYKILMRLVAIIMLCAILKNIQSSFLGSNVSELAFYTCYIVIVSIIMSSFNTALDLGKGIIDSMVGFMQASVPILITLLISSGSITSAGIFQPILITIVEVSATILKNVFVPLIYLSTVLSIIGNISDKVQVAKLSSFLKQINGWTFGIILTLFIAVVSIQGSLGAVVDGVTSKTAKFAISTFIPVAGKYLADAADTAIGCTLLIKNAAGLGVMIGIVSICIAPIIKILSMVLLYRITCVLVEPIAESRITNVLNEVASSMTFILGISASVAFMFLITITVMVSAGNISAMMR